MLWNALLGIVFTAGSRIIDSAIDSVTSLIETNIFSTDTYQEPEEDIISLVLHNNCEAMQTFADTQMQLATVQHQQNELKKLEMMVNVELAEKERELKAHLSFLWRDLKRELQQNELVHQRELQKQQIQADWDRLKLSTIFSRQELEILAKQSDSIRPLFICAKMQVTEGSPNYFRTELVAEAESQIKKFANQFFQGDVRFYSRFFDDENVFDANAAQLKSILPNVPCFMNYSKVTRRSAFLHYQLWGSRSATILKGNFDVELPWREVAQQIRNDAKNSNILDDDLYEMIGDWLTILQKIYAVFLVDFYAIADGSDPFYSIKLEKINFGLPEDISKQYIQPLFETLKSLQNKRIDAFDSAIKKWKSEQEQRLIEEIKRKQEKEDKTHSLCLELIEIPEGIFVMGDIDGDDNEKPLHRVVVSSFKISKYPITQKQYLGVMGNNPSKFKDDKCPVDSVSWFDAKEFCQRLSEILERKVKLPSESQWEYGCRAGSISKYYFGDNSSQLEKYAWYAKNSDKSCPVGQKLPNAFGLYDMYGNVREWCEDSAPYSFRGYNYNLPMDGSAYIDNNPDNLSGILRGGAGNDSERNCRSSCRFTCLKHSTSIYNGFRVVIYD